MKHQSRLSVMEKLFSLFYVLLILFIPSIIIMATVFHVGYHHENEVYHNRIGIIVKMNQNQGVDDSKFHTPVLVKSVLIQDVIDTTMFVELQTYGYNDFYDIISKEWWYNHKAGDTVHFKHIRKDRYFHIRNI